MFIKKVLLAFALLHIIVFYPITLRPKAMNEIMFWFPYVHITQNNDSTIVMVLLWESALLLCRSK
jgi:hypothetical protein